MRGARRFFSGSSLAQALMSAARYHGLAPEDLAYRIHEKRHGFVKHPRNVVLEVDPAAPRRLAGAAAEVPAAAAAPPPTRAEGHAAGSRGGAAPARPRREGHPGERGAAKRRELHEGWSEPDEESILATAEAARAVVALAGLELAVAVRAGEGRVEVELSGAGSDEVRRRGLPLLEEMELLVPRAAHGLSGKMVRCRIDCGGLRGGRERELRELALTEAARAQESGEPRYTEPLTPADRRIIHLALAESEAVETESVGSGYAKRVRISPRVTPA